MELNCPFCGSAPLIFEAEDEYACGNQACFMFSCCATKEEWNRRAESDLLAALKPFAAYACDTPHVNEPPCHNCVAREAIARHYKEER